MEKIITNVKKEIPKKGDLFYYIQINWFNFPKVSRLRWDLDATCNKMLHKSNNYFKTKKEADKVLKLIKKLFKS